MTRLTKSLSQLACIIILSACGHDPDTKYFTFEIAGHTEPCSAGSSGQCFLTRLTPDYSWSAIGDLKGANSSIGTQEIEGFHYEKGYVYRITMQQLCIGSFDGSTYKLELVSINTKVPE